MRFCLAAVLKHIGKKSKVIGIAHMKLRWIVCLECSFGVHGLRLNTIMRKLDPVEAGVTFLFVVYGTVATP